MGPFTILGDIPIRKSEDDELYRSEFVDSLTEFIKELPSNHKNTVGICGPWGCGKTSIANLIKNNLNLNKEKHVVIDFDPWLFSDHTDLTRTFLLHLYKNICSSKGKFVRSALRNPLTRWIVDRISDRFCIGNALIDYIDSISNYENNASVNDLKNKVSNMLKTGKNTYFIFIDDIDRLNPDEIRTIMKLVRSVADFDNVVYILMFDDIIVSKSLNSEAYDGSEYLKKIVQYKFTVPEVNREVLNKHLMENYYKIVEDNDDPYHSIKDVIYECLSYYPLTLREIKNLIAAFNVNYVTSAGNTNPADLLLMTFVKSYHPEIYDWVYKNRIELCRYDHYGCHNRDRIKKIRENYVKLELHERHIKTIEFMFPLFRESFDYNESSAPIFGMGTRRICSPFHIENYFRLVPKSIEFTKSELDEIMYTMPKEQVLDTLYMHYCKGTLDRLMTEIRTQITDPERMMMFTKIVCFVKDHTNDDLLNSNLEQYQQYNFYIQDTAGTIGCTLLQLYSELLNGQDMVTLPLFLRTIEHHSMLWEGIPHLDKKDVTELRAMICEFVRKNYNDFDALNSPTFVILIIVLSTINASLAEEILNKYVKNTDDLHIIHEKRRAKLYWNLFIEPIPEDLRNEYMEQMRN